MLNAHPPRCGTAAAHARRPTHRPTRSPAARGERGVVLILAIIVLVAMSLAAVALMRGVLTGNRVAANLAFQQSAMQSSEVGAETAIAWLEQKSRELVKVGESGRANKLFQTIVAGVNGETYNYVAFREDPALAAAGSAPTNQTWDDYWATSLIPNGRVNTLATDSAGNQVSFVIHRLCNEAGDPSTGVYCEVSPLQEEGNYVMNGPHTNPPPPQVYYRITIRVAGPRNAVSFTQVIVAI